MKYFPLIWAALWRRPVDFFLTLLSVTAAFALFGTMIGFDASVAHLVEVSRPDILYVYPRFSAGALPLAYRDQILRVPGVAKIGVVGTIPGAYYQDTKNRLFIRMIDEGWTEIMPAWFPITPALWQQLQATPNGVLISRVMAERFHLKAGDVFPILTRTVTRADGGKFWPLTVVAIMEESPQSPGGYILGNYSYLDESRPLAQRGTLPFFDVLAEGANGADTAKRVDARFANSSMPTRTDTDRGEAETDSRAGIDIPFVTMVISSAGLFMILFLTGNGIAESVRERIPEFAMLKTLGFSDTLVMALVFAEAAIPCLIGAAIGLGLAAEFAQNIPLLLPGVYLPVPIMPISVLALAMLCAALVALASTIIPVMRLRRLDVASAISGR